tara:strand:+ start:4314 stop:6185 length:1872 start_codon:yes stop_codon:yes gene_type:complete
MKEVVHLLLTLSLSISSQSARADTDWRDILNGSGIPNRSYSDQPYVVRTDDGAWMVVITTAMGKEGADTQHITTQRSFDQGKSWQDLVEVESPEGPEASYAVPLKAPNGRLFVFYNYNADNIRSLKRDPSDTSSSKNITRVDSFGYYVFKYSDDNGKSWSDKRFIIPVRETEIDRQNVYGGKIRFHWNVGKAFILKGVAYVPLIKVGNFGEGFFTSNEGVLLKSKDLLTADDPALAKWETLPDGDIGLRTPEGGGPIASEQSYSVLSDGSIYCVYRTIDGHPVNTYSRDGGHTWEPPQYMRYGNGRRVKNPRAANFAWRCENGKYLYWYHNHGGEWLREQPDRRTVAYRDRNPAWVLGGVEQDGANGKIISWSQPEILLFDKDPMIRMSYPDLIEEGGKYFITETQKDLARVHELDSSLIELLWNQEFISERCENGLVASWDLNNRTVGHQIKAVKFDPFYVRSERADKAGKDTGAGLTIEVSFKLKDLTPGQMLVDGRDKWGKGFWLETGDDSSLEFSMCDGRMVNSWSSDPITTRLNQEHHVSIIVDGGPNVILFVVDGLLNDGGDQRRFGWGRLNPQLHDLNGASHWTVAKSLKGRVNALHVYDRAIKVTEAIGNYRASK